uniref:Uncharacterized protein n=1 Tax=Haptolina brevifila TaxID=156173 RepID=A0A7S2BWG4_9EUKA|mmetsp:Transcript_17460/g.35250  ORF Transcript_17460/g.35250 Transcript_17460/m.35250 type:complete len:149 (+) Transcript_17460:717-1163(+)
MGVCNTLEPILPRMHQRGSGQVALIASVASFMPNADPQWAAYHASKTWLRTYGMALRAFLEPAGVGVTTICPGYVATEMIDTFGSPSISAQATATANAVTGMVHAIRTNVGVHVCPSLIYLLAGGPLAYNMLPPFAFNALFAGFRMPK